MSASGSIFVCLAYEPQRNDSGMSRCRRILSLRSCCAAAAWAAFLSGNSSSLLNMEKASSTVIGLWNTSQSPKQAPFRKLGAVPEAVERRRRAPCRGRSSRVSPCRGGRSPQGHRLLRRSPSLGGPPQAASSGPSAGQRQAEGSISIRLQANPPRCEAASWVDTDRRREESVRSFARGVGQSRPSCRRIRHSPHRASASPRRLSRRSPPARTSPAPL